MMHTYLTTIQVETELDKADVEDIISAVLYEAIMEGDTGVTDAEKLKFGIIGTTEVVKQ